jgi:hypothetical protein
MTGSETTLVLGDEIDRLADQYDRVEAMGEDADDSTSGQAVRWSLNELDQQGNALAALADEHGRDAVVTVRGLTAGEFGRVEDRVDAARARRDDGASMQGYHRVVYAAAGLVEAPFFKPDDVANPPWDERTARQQLDAKIETVAGLNIGLAKWLYSRVDEETTPDAGNWKPSSEQRSASQGG